MAVARLTADGQLDTSFASGGWATVNTGGGDRALAVRLQPDGAILVGNGSEGARLTTTGQLSLVFGPRRLTQHWSSGDFTLQADGKIVMVGGFNSFDITRLTAGGQLDTAFGVGGRVFTNFEATRSGDWPQIAAVAPSGKIVVAGFSFAGSREMWVTRFNADGSLDGAFGIGGKRTLDLGINFGSYPSEIRVIAIASDESIIIAGNRLGPAHGLPIASYESDYLVVRLTSNGELDSSFGSSGKTTIDFTREPTGPDETVYSVDYATSVILNVDGSILVSGYSETQDGDVSSAVQLTPNGQLDYSFGQDGKLVGGAPIVFPTSVPILADGRYFEIGNSDHGVTGYDIDVTLRHANGDLDTSFGFGGTTSLDFGSINETGVFVRVQPDGKILVVGYSDQGGARSVDFVVARLMPATDDDGVDDATEAAAPNGGDGNGDGTLDSQQVNVTSLPSSTPAASYVTLSSPTGTTLASVTAIANPSPTNTPPGVEFPLGHLDFTVNSVTLGGSTTVTIHLPDDTQVNSYFKYGPTPDDPTPHWYSFMFDGTTGAEIFAGPDADSDPEIIVLHFVDGGRGDDDLTVNGTIVDPGAPGYVPTIVVTTTSDAADGDTTSIGNLIINPGADGKISLREAILAANNTAGADGIGFAIPGGGVQTIVVAAPLPAITDSLTIDGYSQAGSTANTLGDGQGSNAVLNIELAGANGITAGAGLVINANDSAVRGLVINRFNGNGIDITGNNNRIEGNFIGMDASGTAALGSPLVYGVHVFGSAAANYIGVSDDGLNDPSERNVISNTQFGITLRGPSLGTVVAGNLIGTNASGNSAIPNLLYGVALLLNTTGNRIGTDADGNSDITERNIISGNGFGGIIVGAQSVVTQSVSTTTIAGNFIGTDISGTNNLGNGNGSSAAFGIGINSALTTIIGGNQSVQSNTIAFNNGPGISIASSGLPELGNSVFGNSIYGNEGLGIKNGRSELPAEPKWG